MTATWILAAGTAGIFLVLAVLTWQLVVTLRQTRQTAVAMEQFLLGTRPKIEGAADQLRSVLGRAEKIIGAAEEIKSGSASLLAAIGKLAAGWNALVQTLSLIAAVRGGVSQVRKARPDPKASAEAQPGKGGCTS